MIAPCESWAKEYHGQTLDRLAQRGGLSPSEAVAVLEFRPWHPMSNAQALALLAEKVAAYNRESRQAELDAKDAELGRLRAKLATAEALVVKIQDAIRDTCHLDPEHQIRSHADSLPNAYRAAAADLERVAAICNEAVLRANPELAT